MDDSEVRNESRWGVNHSEELLYILRQWLDVHIATLSELSMIELCDSGFCEHALNCFCPWPYYHQKKQIPMGRPQRNTLHHRATLCVSNLREGRKTMQDAASPRSTVRINPPGGLQSGEPRSTVRFQPPGGLRSGERERIEMRN